MYLFAAFVAPSSPTWAQQAALDPDLAGLVRTLVVDSVHVGGRNPRQVFVPADSISGSIMRRAGVPVGMATNLTCPGSTDTVGAVSPGILGYVVKVGVTGRENSRKISVFKSCTFIYHGRPREFRQGVDFEAKRENRHWRVKQRINVIIT